MKPIPSALLWVGSSHAIHKSVWKVGEIVGFTGQKVHSILRKNKINTSKPKEFTEEQEAELNEIYLNFKYGDGAVDAFCLKHNKSRANVSRKARKMGLSTRSREGSKVNNLKISQRNKEWHKENEHPKGMIGKKHSPSTIKTMSENLKKIHQNPESYLNSDEYRQILSDRASKNQANGIFKGGYSRGKQGTYDINGKKIFFRSLWEANYALYLDFLVSIGEIKKWEFEKDVFWFLAIKRGVRSYKPDFKVFKTDEIFCYHEVKGWMDNKSKTKLNRMRIYYPEVKIELIDSKRYNGIKKKMNGIVRFF